MSLMPTRGVIEQAMSLPHLPLERPADLFCTMIARVYVACVSSLQKQNSHRAWILHILWVLGTDHIRSDV
jgi:hypothetical protein